VKTLITVIGGSALVAIGALTAAIVQEHTQTAQVASSDTMSIGSTSTQETPATTPATAVAVPAVKAGS
jgi:hypothetical protein